MNRGKFIMRRIGGYIQEHKYVLLTLYAPVYLISFFVMEKLVPDTADYWVSYCPLDDWIPFNECFVLPYYLWYPLLFAVGIYLMIRDVPEFKRYMACIIAGFSFSILFCLLFPNGQDLRPETFVRDNVFTDMVRMLYAADTNTNVIPSVHAVGAIFAAVSVCRTKTFPAKWNRRIKVSAVILSALICMATCFIKQHSVLDVGAAVVLCGLVYAILCISINVKKVIS